MQAPQRQRHAGVIGRLFAEPWRFGFGQAVRLLVQWLRGRGVPYDAALAHALRFENSVDLGFPASEVAALRAEETADGVAGIVLTPACIGLLGAAGTLPLHYTERCAHTAADGNAIGQGLADLCSRRAVTQFWQAGTHHRIEQMADTQGRDGWQPLLLALAGQPDDDSDAALWYAGLLRTRPISAGALERLVASHLGLPVRLDSLVGCWDDVLPRLRSTLGTGNPVLGGGAMLGTRLWQLDRRVRLVIGPLARQDFDRLLPRGQGAAALARLLAMAVRPGMLEFEICLLPAPACIRPLTLTATPGAMVRLGWDSFLTDGSAAAERSTQRAIRYLLRPHYRGVLPWR